MTSNTKTPNQSGIHSCGETSDLSDQTLDLEHGKRKPAHHMNLKVQTHPRSKNNNTTLPPLVLTPTPIHLINAPTNLPLGILLQMLGVCGSSYDTLHSLRT